MALEQKLSQKQVQKMGLYPKMQQALHILQLPIMELRQVIHQELIQNPALEEMQEEVEHQDKESDEETDSLIEEMEKAANSQELWEEYLQNFNHTDTIPGDEKDLYYHQNFPEDIPSLQTHLMRQLKISDCSDYKLGEMVIGNISEDGYLRTSIRDIANMSGNTLQEVEKVVSLIQMFDPLGVGARDLKESLLIQLKPKKENHLAIRMASEYLPELQKKRYNRIAAGLGVDVEHIKKAAEVIATLEPRPGYKFNQSLPRYVIPDITVKKVDDKCHVAVNDYDLPRLRVSPFYKNLLRKNPSQETKRYLAGKFKSALWLIKSIQQRNRTMYRVAQCIVEKQGEFMEKGVFHLKPLRLKDISAELKLHESTISRVITNKYIETEQGIFELKYFFSGILQNDHNNTSTRTIKAKIADIIKHEDPSASLSDNEIAALVEKDGIKIARRTVAKYREQLAILPSHLRKH